MTGPISAGEQQKLLAGYVLYDLSPEEATLVKQWIAADPAIAQEIDRLQQALELAYAPEPAQPPDHIKLDLLNAHRLAVPSDFASPPVIAPGRSATQLGWPSQEHHEPPPRRRLAAVLGAVAAMLIAGLGISNYVLWRSLQNAIAQQEAAEFRTVSLEATENNAADGSVTVALAPAELEALLEVNLPSLPEGQVYVLWTVLQPEAPFTTDEKGAILTHVFTGTEQRETTASVALPPVYRDSQWIKAIAITIEDAAAPQRHKSSPILIEML